MRCEELITSAAAIIPKQLNTARYEVEEKNKEARIIKTNNTPLVERNSNSLKIMLLLFVPFFLLFLFLLLFEGFFGIFQILLLRHIFFSNLH